MMTDYSYCTMTLKDALKIDEDFLDFLQLSTTTQTTTLLNMFKARWDIYEIGGETLEFSKRLLKDKFDTIKEYYQNLINTYEQELLYNDGIKSVVHFETDDSGSNSRGGQDTSSSLDSHIDLPNRTTTGEYVSNKDINEYEYNYGRTDEYEDNKDHTTTTTGNVNVVEQREKYLKYLRNIYLDMVNEFRPCFSMIFA